MLPPLSNSEKMALVVRGRSLVRMIEAARVLRTGATTMNERVTYGMAQELALQALKDMIVELPADLTAEILVASETALGPVRDMFAN